MLAAVSAAAVVPVVAVHRLEPVETSWAAVQRAAARQVVLRLAAAQRVGQGPCAARVLEPVLVPEQAQHQGQVLVT